MASIRAHTTATGTATHPQLGERMTNVEQPASGSEAVREDVEALAGALREGDELAYDNIHADWARQSIAKTILASDWLAAHDKGVRLAERRKRYCGCAWCCSTVEPEKRGETHQRTCQPKIES